MATGDTRPPEDGSVTMVVAGLVLFRPSGTGPANSPLDIIRRAVSMDFTLESRDDVLWVTATGQASLNKAVVVLEKAVDAAVERGTNLILVDCSAVTGKLSVLQQYEVGSLGAEYALQKSKPLKVAVVGQPPVIDGFAALVASNRGVTTETFSDTSNAVEWLNRFARSVYHV